MYSDLETKERGQRRLLIVKGPRATVDASVVCVKTISPVVKVFINAELVIVGASLT
jgi:hypothetical protein